MPRAARNTPPSRLNVGFPLLFACWVACGIACGGETRPNLLLVSVDTLRADHVGAYGYARETTPLLDRLASEGVLFEQVLANSPWTLPSHVSLLTGLVPRTHGVKNHRTGLTKLVPTLATHLRDAGWRTLALSNSHNISPRYGLSNGFDEFVSYPEIVEKMRIRSMPEEVSKALAWIDAGEEPFFVFLHSYDVHSDYDPAPDYAQDFVRENGSRFTPNTATLNRVRKGELEMSASDVARTIDFYDAGLREFDADFEVLIEGLEERGLLDRTLVVVTSDHGEEFLEHGGVLHGRQMYDESLRVPLVMRGPGVPTGRRVTGWAQLTDVKPTALSLLGVPVPDYAEGIDLRAAFETGRIEADRVVVASSDHRNEQDDRKRALVRDGYKLILDRVDGTRELYDLARDPGEREDLASRDPERTEAMLALLQRYEAGHAEPQRLAPLEDEERERLKALGYLE